jgi:hypothetical protein
MDFRMYDNALGRFLGIDKLAEFSYSITPYRFAYNNPVYWSDPTGLFETKDEAKKWAKDNGIRTGWFSKNKIEKSEDGTWAVNNKKKGTSHFAVSEIHSDIMGVDAGTVVSSPLLVAESPEKNKSFGLAVWGDDRAGDTRGWKGTTTHSIESSEIPGISLRARDIRGKSSILDLIRNFFTGAKDVAALSNKVSPIQKINEKPNTSTMEVQNTESVAPPEIITVILDTTHHTHLHPEMITIKRTGKKAFTGTKEQIKKSKDSINESNKLHDNWWND